MDYDKAEQILRQFPWLAEVYELLGGTSETCEPMDLVNWLTGDIVVRKGDANLLRQVPIEVSDEDDADVTVLTRRYFGYWPTRSFYQVSEFYSLMLKGAGKPSTKNDGCIEHSEPVGTLALQIVAMNRKVAGFFPSCIVAVEEGQRENWFIYKMEQFNHEAFYAEEGALFSVVAYVESK